MARNVTTKITATDDFSQTLETLRKQLIGVAGTLSQVSQENKKQTSRWDIIKRSMQSASGAFQGVAKAISDGYAPIAKNTQAYGKLSKVVKLQKANLKQMTKDNLKGNAAWNKLSVSIALNEKKMKSYQSRSLKRMIKMTGKAAKETVGLGKRFRALKHSIKIARISTTKWQRTTKASEGILKVTGKALKIYGKGALAAGKMTAKFYKKAGGIGLKVMSQGLSLIGQKLVRINEGFGRIAGGGIKALKQGISDILRGGLQRLVETVRNFSISSVKQFADLELSMKKINIFGNLGLQSEEEFDKLQGSLNKMTKTSLFSMTEVSSAFESVAAIGDFAKEGVEGLTAVSEAVVNMATATGEADLEKTAEVLMTTMNAFNIASGDAMLTASILTKVANDSALSINSLGDALGYVAGTAQFAGIPLSETTAALAILSNQGLSASKSGTALNQALQKMTKPTAGAADLMNELGVSFFDAKGELKSFEQIIPELSSTLNGLSTEEERLAVLGELFGVRGKRAIAALLNDFNQAGDGISEFGSLLANLNDIKIEPQLDEFGQPMFDKLGQQLFLPLPVELQSEEMMATLAGSMAKLSGSFEVMQATFGEILAPAIGAVADSLASLTENPIVLAFMQQLAESIGQLILSLEPLIILLMESFMPVLQELEPVIGMITNIIQRFFAVGEDGTSIFGNIIAILLLVINVVLQLFEAFAPIVELILSELLPIILELADAFVSDLMPILMEVIGALLPFIRELLPMIKMVANMFLSLMPIISFILKLFMELAMQLMSALMPVIKALINAILDNRQTIVALMKVVGVLIAIFIVLMPIIELLAVILVALIEVLSWVLQMFGKLVNLILDGVIWVFDKLLGVLSGVVDAFNYVLGLMGLGSDGMDEFADAVNRARDEIKGMKLDLDTLGNSDMEMGDMDMDELSSDLGPTLADEIIEGVDDGAEEAFQGYTFPEDTFDDSPVDINTDSLEEAADDISEFALSGTSVQDILDLGALTGVTPTEVGPNDPQASNDGDTRNNYNITVDGDIIIETADGEVIDDVNMAQRIAEELLGGGGSGVRYQ